MPSCGALQTNVAASLEMVVVYSLQITVLHIGVMKSSELLLLLGLVTAVVTYNVCVIDVARAEASRSASLESEFDVQAQIKKSSAGSSVSVMNDAVEPPCDGNQARLSVASPPSSEDVRALRTVRIELHGNAFGRRQQRSKINEFLAGAAHAMASKGFISMQQGLRIDSEQGDSQRGPVDLSFPCEVSAVGFYLLFKNYEWESSDGFHSMTVNLSNNDFDRQIDCLDPEVRFRFYSPSEVTPANVLEYLPLSANKCGVT